ncbi:MAG: hypothetical protein MI924_05060 [Chloroflexales bacterium]|nr:hypothetical protein [Chloroflexales bacterium]
MDTQATVAIGPLFRGGKSRIPPKVVNHDFQSEAKVMPVGFLVTAGDALFIDGMISDEQVACVRILRRF